jgi:hypothetical protein
MIRGVRAGALKAIESRSVGSLLSPVVGYREYTAQA